MTFRCQETATQCRWCLVHLQLVPLRPAMPQGHGICHRASRYVCPAVPLHLGQCGVGVSLPPFWDLAECDCAPSVVPGRRRAEGLEEGWVSLKQSGWRCRSHSAQAVWGWLCCSGALAGAVPCTMTSVLSSSIWAPLVAVHVYFPRSCWLTLWRVRVLESSVYVCRDRRSGSITARCVCGR